MTAAGFPAPHIDQIERLLRALSGIVSARVVAASDGRPEEIHVIAAPGLHAKQVVRNIESALNARFGLDIDRRIISVAQVNGGNGQAMGDDDETFGGGVPAASEAAATIGATERRLVFVGFEATSRTAQGIVCRVLLRRDEELVEGTGEGPDTQHGRCEAGARALFNALAAARGDDSLVLEGVTLLLTHGREMVLVAARALAGRASLPLSGAAPLGRSPEEAAVYAALQATNRWATRED
ncbi:MAG: hypothetical protein ACRELD_02680 [Longimicrobiales bacterium]